MASDFSFQLRGFDWRAPCFHYWYSAASFAAIYRAAARRRPPPLHALPCSTTPRLFLSFGLSVNRWGHAPPVRNTSLPRSGTPWLDLVTCYCNGALYFPFHRRRFYFISAICARSATRRERRDALKLTNGSCRRPELSVPVLSGLVLLNHGWRKFRKLVVFGQQCEQSALMPGARSRLQVRSGRRIRRGSGSRIPLS